jgi:hypothetical protein
MHLPSHWISWGQTRPQTAGRLFCFQMWRMDWVKSPSLASRMNPGMSTPTGQPSTQPGVLALQAARRLLLGHLRGVPRRDLEEVPRPHLGLLLGHPHFAFFLLLVFRGCFFRHVVSSASVAGYRARYFMNK